jgi:hypothetical protein
MRAATGLRAWVLSRQDADDDAVVVDIGHGGQVLDVLPGVWARVREYAVKGIRVG